jgi:(p)ppGpp synthase/HD superfamily hydrolase
MRKLWMFQYTSRMTNQLIDRAILFATQAHAGQRRKESIQGFDLPYITHPLEVLKLVWSWGAANEVTAPAAVLHDVVEDCGVAWMTITDEFGNQVADIVRQLTCMECDDKLGYMLSFKDPGRTSVEALVIKLADRICNVQDYLLHNPKYAAKYMRKAIALDEAIAARFDEITARWNHGTALSVDEGWQSLWQRVMT